jgi:2-polyprenyl-6-methoxyphenol hydroxylase-like FAD-dependent oxidoreductase
MNYDLVIAGGGIAGSALATVMARAGHAVLVLEKTTEYPDLVRGEWIAPWGVVEAKRTGLLKDLVAAGGHYLKRHIAFGEGIDPDEAIGSTLDMSRLLPGVPGPLCLRHPVACQVLTDTAVAAGATVLRGVSHIVLTDGPGLRYTHDGAEHTASARLVVGADGRNSVVRNQANIAIHRDPTHHLFSGLLVEAAEGWPEDVQTKGTEGDVNFLAFPQGKGVVRLYLGYGMEQKTRLTGPDAPKRFLEAFNLRSVPWSDALVHSNPISHCHSYPNEDTWTDEPFAEGIVLVGDSAGHNDPIIGQGLSIALRDVRIVSELLLGSAQWESALFAPYAEERAERMRRLRFVAALQSALDSEFTTEATIRRKRAEERKAADPSLNLVSAGVMIGPEMLPGEIFSRVTWDRILA